MTIDFKIALISVICIVIFSIVYILGKSGKLKFAKKQKKPRNTKKTVTQAITRDSIEHIPNLSTGRIRKELDRKFLSSTGELKDAHVATNMKQFLKYIKKFSNNKFKCVKVLPEDFQTYIEIAVESNFITEVIYSFSKICDANGYTIIPAFECSVITLLPAGIEYINKN